MSGVLKVKLREMLDKDQHENVQVALRKSLDSLVSNPDKRKGFIKHVSPYLFYLQSSELDMFYSALHSMDQAQIQSSLPQLLGAFELSEDLKKVFVTAMTKTVLST
jgi:hypothetical protein